MLESVSQGVLEGILFGKEGSRVDAAQIESPVLKNPSLSMAAAVACRDVM